MFDDSFSLTTATILKVFNEEVEGRGGRLINTFDDGRRLFVRSLLPHIGDVRPNDRMQGGLALRATDREVWLHPYLFREVCRNGAITAHSLESLHLERLELYTPEVAMSLFRDAIADCSEEPVFAQSLDSVRSAADTELDELLDLMPHIHELQQNNMSIFVAEILHRFSAERDRSQLGFMNAVTSVARDTSDPDARWRLEEFGGGIAAGLLPPRPSDAPGQRRVYRASRQSDPLAQLEERLQCVDARIVAVAEVD